MARKATQPRQTELNRSEIALCGLAQFLDGPRYVFVPLTQGKWTVIDAADAEAVLKFRWHARQVRCRGYRLGWYAARSVGSKTIHLHRVIAGTPDGMETDHVNQNSLDNRRANLRHATRSQNAANLPNVRNSSGLRGVTWNRPRRCWQACIRHGGKLHHLGYFTDPFEAARARDEKAVELHGEFARLNTAVTARRAA
jgi:hypothetical protein